MSYRAKFNIFIGILTVVFIAAAIFSKFDPSGKAFMGLYAGICLLMLFLNNLGYKKPPRNIMVFKLKHWVRK